MLEPNERIKGASTFSSWLDNKEVDQEPKIEVESPSQIQSASLDKSWSDDIT